MIEFELPPPIALFVDDEPNILVSLRRELREWSEKASVKILTAPSAREALKILESRGGEITVVVSDLMMPEMKGSDFLLIVRERWPEIFSILLTGFSETEEIIKCVKAGIFSYILKPWDAPYLESEISRAIEAATLRRQNAFYRGLFEDELRWAGEMQRALLKPSLLSSEGVEFRTSYRPNPGLYCGGDYYDVLKIASGRYLLLLGEVEGQGVKAAFVTGILKAIIFPEYVANFLSRPFSPAALLGWLNERIGLELRQTSTVSIALIAGVIDTNAMLFTYACAGHSHPYIVTSSGPRELPISGSALGFARSSLYVEKTEKLGSGDLVVLFSDGLLPSGEKAKGFATKSILAETALGPDFHRRIMEKALEKQGKAEFHDDVTIVTALIQ